MSARGGVGVLFDGPEDGARAMARDEVLVEWLAQPDAVTHMFRAHGWLHPTLTVGRVQKLPTGLIEEAAACGVEVVRRPTGGGWLFHAPGDLALTLAVAGPLRAGDLRRSARLAAQAIAMGLAACGQPAVVLTGLRTPASRADVCFMRADRDEVVVGGVKVVGVALARVGRSALVQTATPLAPESRDLTDFVSRWDPRRKAAVEAAGGIDRDVFWRGATDAVSQILDTPAAAQHWPGPALKLAEILRHAKYQNVDYTREGRAPERGRPGSEAWEGGAS